MTISNNKVRETCGKQIESSVTENGWFYKPFHQLKQQFVIHNAQESALLFVMNVILAIFEMNASSPDRNVIHHVVSTHFKHLTINFFRFTVFGQLKPYHGLHLITGGIFYHRAHLNMNNEKMGSTELLSRLNAY